MLTPDAIMEYFKTTNILVYFKTYICIEVLKFCIRKPFTLNIITRCISRINETLHANNLPD